MEFFEDEIVPLKRVMEEPSSFQWKSNYKLSTQPTLDSMIAWGFVLLISQLCLILALEQGLPKKFLSINFFFILYVLYIVFNYRGDFIFDLPAKQIFYRSKIGFLPQKVVFVGNFEDISGLLVTHALGRETTHLILLLGEKLDLSEQSIEAALPRLRMERKMQSIKIQDGDWEEQVKAGNFLAKILDCRIFCANKQKPLFLGSGYQINQTERTTGYGSLVQHLMLFGFVVFLFVLVWEG